VAQLLSRCKIAQSVEARMWLTRDRRRSTLAIRVKGAQSIKNEIAGNLLIFYRFPGAESSFVCHRSRSL
jgi:hypothetical protein